MFHANVNIVSKCRKVEVCGSHPYQRNSDGEKKKHLAVSCDVLNDTCIQDGGADGKCKRRISSLKFDKMSLPLTVR